MKILYTTTIGSTMVFFSEYIKSLLDEGHTVDIACNYKESQVPECYKEWECRVYYLPCMRSPLAGGNLKTVQRLKRIVEKEEYDIVHCHTPVAAVCTRIACLRARRKGTRVFYTAHGFHFYKGAPLKNWLLYYPVEWMCSWWTDVLITINKEDYKRAKKKFHAKETIYVPGVGVDMEKFQPDATIREKKRAELGLKETDIMILSVGELNRNKNHAVVIRALAELNNKNLHYFITGQGELRDELILLADDLKICGQVHLTGYRADVSELMQAADIFVLPSIREGLNVSLMEAMASGLPCIAGRIRGNTDLIADSNCLAEAGNAGDWKRTLENMAVCVKNEKTPYGEENRKRMKKYDILYVNKTMKRIYSKI